MAAAAEGGVGAQVVGGAIFGCGFARGALRVRWVPRVVCVGFGLGLFGLKEAMDLAVRIGFTGGGVSRFIVGRHDCFESD